MINFKKAFRYKKSDSMNLDSKYKEHLLPNGSETFIQQYNLLKTSDIQIFANDKGSLTLKK